MRSIACDFAGSVARDYDCARDISGRVNLEGQEDTDRLDYIWTAHVEPLFGPVYDQIREMGREENLQPVSARAMFFIVTHGAAAPYTLDALSRRFDTIDGPLAAEVHAELLTEMIMTSLPASDQT